MGDARMDIIVQNSVKVAARVELLADPLRPEPAFAGLAGLAVGDGDIVVALQTHRHAQTGHAIGLQAPISTQPASSKHPSRE